MSCCCSWSSGGRAVAVIGAAGSSSGGGGAAPVAAFSGTPLSGDEPLTVTFTDESTGVVLTWFWEKSDDGGSNWVPFDGTPNAQNPVEDFTVGLWDVRLTVSNAFGSDDETKSEYVTSVDPALHRYWQITRWSVESTSGIEMSEVRLFEGAVDVTAFAVALTSTTPPSSGSLANLWDDDLMTVCGWDDTVVRAAGWNITFDYGPDPANWRSITSLKGGGATAFQQYWRAFALNYSDDDVTYTEVGAIRDLAYPGDNTLSGAIVVDPWVEVPVGTTFNPADKTANITLSGSDYIASKSNANFEAVRSISNWAAGDGVRFYFEIEILAFVANDPFLGLYRTSVAILSGNNPNLAPGAEYAAFRESGNHLETWTPSGLGGVGAWSVGDVMGYAVDLVDDYVWAFRNGTILGGLNSDPPALIGWLWQSNTANAFSIMYWTDNNAGANSFRLRTSAADLLFPQNCPIGFDRGVA